MQTVPFAPLPQSERDDFAAWCALNDADKEAQGLPLTLISYAKSRGIDRVTLWRWEKDSEFQKSVVQHIQSYAISRAGYVLRCWESHLPRSWRACQAWWDSLIAPALRQPGADSSDLAQALVRAVTASDFGRVAMAHYAAVQAKRGAVDAEQVEEEQVEGGSPRTVPTGANVDGRSEAGGDVPLDGSITSLLPSDPGIGAGEPAGSGENKGSDPAGAAGDGDAARGAAPSI